MSNGTKEFNGWTNYETWCVNLWLTNDYSTYKYWMEEADRHGKASRCTEEGRTNYCTADEIARSTLSSQLKSEIEDASPIQEPSLFSDLLNAALSEVDWHEIAHGFLDRVEPDGEPFEDYESDSVDEFQSIRRRRIWTQHTPLFELGKTVCTPNALKTLTTEEIYQAVSRHERGDWGAVKYDDWQSNEEALKEGSRLFSVYHSRNETKFWVITEADRSSTCVLLPDEY